MTLSIQISVVDIIVFGIYGSLNLIIEKKANSKYSLSITPEENRDRFCLSSSIEKEINTLKSKSN
jgi:hypothetical protein